MKAMVNPDVLAGEWKQVRGVVKHWWGKLTDNDLDRINGRIEQLTGIIQERYGYTRQQAEQEVERFLDQLTNK